VSPAIEIHNLLVTGTDRCRLDVADFRAEPGTLLALMGPNGAGKTTLLHACLGLATVARGTVRVLGTQVETLSAADRARLRRRLGYVPQILSARGELPLTVREVVAIGRTARAGCGRRLTREDWQTVDRWIDQLGLSSLAHHSFGEISGGEQRKTILARAMAQEPELLLLDEPTAHLDLGWRERIVETIDTLHSQTRLAVILVCHELEVLPVACRHVVLLNQGRVAANGTPESVLTSQSVSALYGARFQAVHQHGRHAVIPGGGAHD
jgi:ABC-type cobalamin/Fe3+-siderophores transport system ATPase subunit